MRLLGKVPTRRNFIFGATLAARLLSRGLSGAPSAYRSLYTLSANIETLFPKDIPRDRRIELVAAAGLKAFSFWNVDAEEERAMLAAQKRTGLSCGSIAGSGRIGWTTGLTRPGFESAYFEVIGRNCEVASRFGAPNLVIFVGEIQKDVPWERQYRNIIAGLQKAGEIAAKYDVYLCLEPLNRVDAPQMSVLTAREGFQIVTEVDHPNVRLDFDIYHLQLSEGNLINNLRLGLEKGWIQFVEIGDVPGRKEPGTGEINFYNIFRTLRELDYEGFIGMEHGTSSTPEHAMSVVRSLVE